MLDIFLDVDIMFLILVNIRMVIKKNFKLGCKLFFLLIDLWKVGY